MGVLATDNFNRADNTDLGSSWDVMTGENNLKISSNTVIPNAMFQDCTETYNGVTWPNDQYSQADCVVTGGSSSADNGIGVALRGATGARTYYRICINDAASQNVGISKQVAGSYTNLSFITSAWSGSHTLKATISGSSPATITAYKDGVSIGSTTDSSIASGRAGLMYSSTVTTASLDNWEGGDLGGTLWAQSLL